MQASIYKKTLDFKFKAGTSRGYYTTRDIYIVKLEDGNTVGFGECAYLKDLSCDDLPYYEDILIECAHDICTKGIIDFDKYTAYPSIIFGLETALLHLKHNDLCFFKSPFVEHNEGIVINGLIWMGDIKTMMERLYEKMQSGFRCIKIKIGAIDFNDELFLLKTIRDNFSQDELEIRIDANGAFKADEAFDYLNKLSVFDIHSIEQPIAKDQYEALNKICHESPLAIALDEELIGHHSLEDKEDLLDKVAPQYIVLKPSLHGGIKGCDEWISLAKERGIGYWITSALESNIGLNAIAQYASSKAITLPQGLGTGLLYHNNIDFPLYIKKDKLYFAKDKVNSIDFEGFIKDSDRIL